MVLRQAVAKSFSCCQSELLQSTSKNQRTSQKGVRAGAGVHPIPGGSGPRVSLALLVWSSPWHGMLHSMGSRGRTNRIKDIRSGPQAVSLLTLSPEVPALNGTG